MTMSVYFVFKTKVFVPKNNAHIVLSYTDNLNCANVHYNESMKCASLSS